MAVTGTRRAVLDYVIRACDEGVAPTMREIGAAVGLASTNAVNDHVDTLVGLRLLTKTAGAVRSLRPTMAGRQEVGRPDPERCAHQRGVIFAAAFVARDGHQSLAVELLRTCGLHTRAALFDSGADEQDLCHVLPLVGP